MAINTSSARRQQRLRLFCALLLLLCALALAPLRTKSADLHIHPYLVTLAQTAPNARVRVIVQQTGPGAQAAAAVEKLGGEVVKDLSIIRAFTAELPAHAVLDLGQTSGVRWISLDALTTSSACTNCIDTSKIAATYLNTIRADQVWNRSPYVQGQGIGIAVIDSGINPVDYYTIMGTPRLVAAVFFNDGWEQHPYDVYGHGDQVASIVGSSGQRSGWSYPGVAPMSNIINVKVSDEYGRSSVSNVIEGLQWVFENAQKYNIRVVNLSLNDTTLESYHTSALDAAVEVLWFNKIVVVASAGNTGAGGLYAPANDPFVITVGATDDRGTSSTNDDLMAFFSAYGSTLDGYAKPDLVAPGANIVTLLSRANSTLAGQHPGNVSAGSNGNKKFRMSGTSMSAPMVAAAAALVLQVTPKLTPDQVKYRLMKTARPFADPLKSGAGLLNIEAAVFGNTTEKANQNLAVSRWLWNSTTPLIWNALTEGSVQWHARGTDFWGQSRNDSDLNHATTWGSDYWGSTTRSNDGVWAEDAQEIGVHEGWTDEELDAQNGAPTAEDVFVPTKTDPPVATTDAVIHIFLPLIQANVTTEEAGE